MKGSGEKGLFVQLSRRLSLFDGLLRENDEPIANFAQSSVLLFAWYLNRDEGLSNDQTVYPYSVGFEPESFVDLRMDVDLDPLGEIDMDLIRIGSMTMLVSDLRDDLVLAHDPRESCAYHVLKECSARHEYAEGADVDALLRALDIGRLDHEAVSIDRWAHSLVERFLLRVSRGICGGTRQDGDPTVFKR